VSTLPPSPALPPALSKSKYLAGCQCERRVWLTCRAPELATPPDARQQAIFELGHDVGRCAHALFPGGVLVRAEPWEHRGAIELTRALLADTSVPAIFEAAFEHDGVRIRADVLERLPGGGFGLREVKAVSTLRPVHSEDCAVQLHVLEGCGLRIESVELIHVNTAYVRGPGEIDWASLFVRRDLTREATESLPRVRERVARFHAVLGAPGAPVVNPSRHCFDPYGCEFWEHCTRARPRDWIFHLPQIRRDFDVLSAAGVERIVEIPEEHPLPKLHVRIRSALRSGRAQVEPELGAVLQPAGPPAHYLDFESMSPPIPLYAGTRPYQAIPFQWSLHSADGCAPLRHRELLADESGDPRRPLAEGLLAALGGDHAPVVVYSGFERRCIRELEERFPDLAPGLRRIRERLFDLLPVVRRHLYHPGFDFSFSIKSVAPALAPDLGWDDLGEIAEGTAASAAFAALASGTVPGEEREALRAGLRAYCARDTLALARVHAVLCELAVAAP
jgi:hypothetical protein